MNPHKTHRGGFTLTELLIVIVIIVVLAALSMLGVNRFREKAYASVCMNNMRQVAADQIALCQENNGGIVHTDRSMVQGSPMRSWQFHHTVYKSDQLDWKVQPWNDLVDEAEKMEHLQCPTAYRLKKSEMDELTGWRKVSTYAMNGLIGLDGDPESANAPSWIRGAPTLGSVQHPSTLVLAIEKEWASWGVYSNGAGGIAKVHEFAKFHNGGFNVAFYDGHVEFGKHGEFPIWTKPGFSYGDDEFMRYWIGMDNFR